MSQFDGNFVDVFLQMGGKKNANYIPAPSDGCQLNPKGW